MKFEEKKIKSGESVSSERPEALEKNPKFLLEKTEAKISEAEKELEMIEKNDVPIQEVKKKINIIRGTLNSALHALQILGTFFPLFIANPQKIEAAPPSGFGTYAKQEMINKTWTERERIHGALLRQMGKSDSTLTASEKVGIWVKTDSIVAISKLRATLQNSVRDIIEEHDPAVENASELGLRGVNFDLGQMAAKLHEVGAEYYQMELGDTLRILERGKSKEYLEEKYPGEYRFARELYGSTGTDQGGGRYVNEEYAATHSLTILNLEKHRDDGEEVIKKFNNVLLGEMETKGLDKAMLKSLEEGLDTEEFERAPEVQKIIKENGFMTFDDVRGFVATTIIHEIIHGFLGKYKNEASDFEGWIKFEEGGTELISKLAAEKMGFSIRMGDYLSKYSGFRVPLAFAAYHSIGEKEFVHSFMKDDFAALKTKFVQAIGPEGENLWNKILAEDGDSYEALQKLYTMLSERDPSFKETLQRAMDEGQIAKWVLQGEKAKPDAALYKM